VRNLIVGDVVMLKTGGPRMTIVEISKKNKCTCAFFIDTTLKYVKAPMNSLENVTDVQYDEGNVIPVKLETFTDFVKTRDDADASTLVDESSMIVLTKYIEQDQPAVLARIEGSELVFSEVEQPVEKDSSPKSE
jgi:uncharacterized protein YodC (DUF2158 family)